MRGAGTRRAHTSILSWHRARWHRRLATRMKPLQVIRSRPRHATLTSGQLRQQSSRRHLARQPCLRCSQHLAAQALTIQHQAAIVPQWMAHPTPSRGSTPRARTPSTGAHSATRSRGSSFAFSSSERRTCVAAASPNHSTQAVQSIGTSTITLTCVARARWPKAAVAAAQRRHRCDRLRRIAHCRVLRRLQATHAPRSSWSVPLARRRFLTWRTRPST